MTVFVITFPPDALSIPVLALRPLLFFLSSFFPFLLTYYFYPLLHYLHRQIIKTVEASLCRVSCNCRGNTGKYGNNQRHDLLNKLFTGTFFWYAKTTKKRARLSFSTQLVAFSALERRLTDDVVPYYRQGRESSTLAHGTFSNRSYIRFDRACPAPIRILRRASFVQQKHSFIFYFQLYAKSFIIIFPVLPPDNSSTTTPDRRDHTSCGFLSRPAGIHVTKHKRIGSCVVS